MAEKRPSLNVLSGPLSGRKLVLEDAVDNILIGSDPSCGFVLDTPGVSPIHARLWVDLNGATVYDTNSPNGVYVNDDRVVKEAANPWYEITLVEGRNRQIRRMFEAVGHHVEKIKRVRYGPLLLDVPPGKFRSLTLREIEKLKSASTGTMGNKKSAK